MTEQANETDIQTYATVEQLMHATAEEIIFQAAESIATRGYLALALAGGSTPRQLYTLLANKDLSARINWSRVYLFWGDERCVPPDHPDSNYRMAYDSLIKRVPIPASNIYRIPGEQRPEQAAEHYQNMLQNFFAAPLAEEPMATFDMALLGMGTDGHTASLFPGTAALQEQTRLVVAHYVEQVRAWRITLTPAALNHARHIVFLVAGAEKAERLQQVLQGEEQPDVLPAQVVQPVHGKVRWMVDAAAASALEE
jgi:6-phosphogluconolactonase